MFCFSSASIGVWVVAVYLVVVIYALDFVPVVVMVVASPANLLQLVTLQQMDYYRDEIAYKPNLGRANVLSSDLVADSMDSMALDFHLAMDEVIADVILAAKSC